MGAAHTIFFNPLKVSVILIENIKPHKPPLYGFPGGYIENGETPEEAAKREAEEEVGITIHRPIAHTLTIRSMAGRNYRDFFYLCEDPGVKLRSSGTPDETGPPKRISLNDIADGKIKIFTSHLYALSLLLSRKYGKDDPDLQNFFTWSSSFLRKENFSV
jgi:8-oxo-dGTP pyrophosphatase MutT (NUDIX family)